MLSNHEITMSWQGVSAQINGKHILYASNGYCRPGEMLAIMGPSGAGKTTLLSMLSQKTDPNITRKGKVLANKVEFDGSGFYNFGSYIYQNDILHENLTVRETLHFTAVLKINDPIKASARVDQLIKEFQLQNCQDGFVGGQIKKGISGGEKKRVCIAVEMVTKPSVLILDQPTSGLDSNKAGKVLKVLKKLAKENHSIIFTIHQPSFLLYSLLDRLVLLDKGHMIYQGPAQTISNYMSQQLKISIPNNVTVCDFFMMEISEYKADKFNHTTQFNPQNYQLFLAPAVEKQMKKISNEEAEGFAIITLATNFLFMFSTLLKRGWTIYKRNPMKFGGMIANSMVGMIMIGIFFRNGIVSTEQLTEQGSHLTGEKGVQILRLEFIGFQGVCFINIVSQFFTGLNSVALSFPIEREIYCKESATKKYSALSYFLSKVILEFSSLIFGTILYASVGYFLNGFTATFEKWLLFTIVLGAIALVGNSVGILTGTLFQDAKTATAMGPLLILPLMMFSGLYNRLDSIPDWISWLQYISPFRYGLHLLLTNQYENAVFYTSDGLAYDYRSDLEVKYSFNLNLIIVLGIACLFQTIAFFFLRARGKNISV